MAKGLGWIETTDTAASDTCFAHYALSEATELSGASGRRLAQALCDYFLRSSQGEIYDGAWPLVIEGCGEEGVARRANRVQDIFLDLARKRLARVIKLAIPGRPAAGPHRGLFAFLSGLDRLHVSRSAVFGGQRRMADDAQAPSRSYLKVEEAYVLLGRTPQAGESVADLGAAPGGWSYSAAKRGARVVAVDNGPLKGGAAGHPLISPRAEDAFTFESVPVDWLFCDMLENPDRVLGLVRQWLSRGLCRRFIVNLKFGRIDPLPLLRRVRTLEAYCSFLRIRHLFHDREEVTLVGQTRS